MGKRGISAKELILACIDGLESELTYILPLNESQFVLDIPLTIPVNDRKKELDKHIKYIECDEKTNKPVVIIDNLYDDIYDNIKKWFEKRSYLKDILDVEYIVQSPYLYTKIILKVPKKKYYFWYGYMKLNGSL